MKKSLLAMAVVITMGINGITHLPIEHVQADVKTETKENKTQSIRVEVTEVEKYWTWAVDVNEEKYVLENEDYEVGDVVLAEINEYGEIESTEKRNEETIVISSIDGEWATGYNELKEAYVLYSEGIEVGDVIKASVNVYLEIFTTEKINQETLTERFMIQYEDEEGNMIGKGFEKGTGVYLFNKEYKHGDIVEIVTGDSHDVPLSERLIEGKELEKIEEEYEGELEFLKDEGIALYGK